MIDDILLFVSLVKTKNFDKCSAINHISASTLSRRIKGLELTLGYSLLLRNSHRIDLTENGRNLYLEFENYANNLVNLLASIEQEKRAISGRLHVSLPFALAYYYILPFLGEFLFQYPDLEVFIDHNVDEFNIKHKSYDLAITNYQPSQQTQKIKQIANEKIVLVCTPQYVEMHGRLENLSEINRHLTIGKISQSQKIISLIPLFDEITSRVTQVTNQSRIHVNSFIEVEQLINSNQVIAGMPLSVVEQRIQDNSLVRILPNYHLGIMNYYLSRTINENDPRYKVFIKFIYKCLEKIKYTEVSSYLQYFHS